MFPIFLEFVCLFWAVAAFDCTKHSDSECSKTPIYSSIIVNEFSLFSTWELTSVTRNSSKITFKHSAAPPWHLMPQLHICCTMCCWSVSPGRRCLSCSLFAFPLYWHCCSASCCAGHSQLQNNQLAFSWTLRMLCPTILHLYFQWWDKIWHKESSPRTTGGN